MADPTRPNLSNKKLTRPDPGQKFLTRTYHYSLECGKQINTILSRTAHTIKLIKR